MFIKELAINFSDTRRKTMADYSKKNNLTEQEKLKYLQNKIHETTLECLNNYILLRDKLPLLQTTLALIFMEFRNSVETNISLPFRYKSFESVRNNIAKEVMNKIKKLPDNCSTEDIDKIVEAVVRDVSKDFFGATFVFNNKNNLKNYCEESDNVFVQKLYNQLACVDNYLFESEAIENSSSFGSFFNKFKTIDISSTYVDDDKSPKSPKKLKPLNIKEISTPKDYYTQLINLLTLLTNISTPCTENGSDKTHKYSVSQTDISYFKLVERVQKENPRNNDEFIKKLTQLAHSSYYVAYEPFDIQLEKAINAKNEAKKSSNYSKPLNDDEKFIYLQHLEQLKKNLESSKNDRLLNNILKIELPNIFDRLSNLPNLNVEIISQKERAKENGFYAIYYILRINNIAEFELQAHSEFRSNIGKEGSAAHFLMPGKSFDIRHLFELNEKMSHPFDDSLLNFYCDFLETVNLNNITEYKISKEDIPSLRKLQELVEYASSKVKVKDYIEYDNKTISFFDYIQMMLSNKGAEFGAVYPAHRIEHNQALVVPQNSMFSLENLLKSRTGFSTLANLVRTKYKEEATNRNIELLPKDISRAYSSSLAPNNDLLARNNALKQSIENFEPLDVPFRPMGQYRNDNSSNNKDDDVQEL